MSSSRKITAYKAGKNVKGSIKLSSNESPFPPSPTVKQAIFKAAQTAHIYPDTEHSALKKQIIQQYKLNSKTKTLHEKNIIIGNGSDEVLSVIGQCFFNKGDKIVIPKNTFSVYTIVSQIADASITYVPLQQGYINLGATKKNISAKTKAVFVCNPNNPTGTAHKAKDIYAFAKGLPKQTLFILDEAYTDFTTAEYRVNPSQLFLLHSHSVILRTFSKVFALGGARIGYGISNEKIIQQLKLSQIPFSINCFALAAAQSAITDKIQYKKTITHIDEERKKMTAFLQKHNIDFFESHANFICIDARQFIVKKNKQNLADALYDIFAKNKIIIRSLTSFGMPSHVRISIGKKTDNNKVRKILYNLLSQ